MGKSSIPKYSIRVGLVWFLPILSVLCHCFLCVPAFLAVLATPVEVPKLRQKICNLKVRKHMPCFKVPALLRLSALWVLQAWWLVMWRAQSDMANPEPDSSDADLGVGPGWDDYPTEDLSWAPASMSVVIPCAGEGEYSLKTVQTVYETTPSNVLKEIIVVDDGSSPPLSTNHLGEEARRAYGVRVIRHDKTVGLIGAKKDGGDAAVGDVVVFFDCHVAPQPGWHKEFLTLMRENYRRVVVPEITDLDIDTWKQRRGSRGQSKCYITWDADFKWFNSPDRYVPILSGGLLAISKRWWNETGGYDEHMTGWGGENLDQSLRTWLCGGEIVIASKAQVAHMWRVPSDPRTKAHYWAKSSAANRMRAAAAWYGAFTAKLKHFPFLSADKKDWGGHPWYGDISNTLDIKKKLKCRSFAWFLRRFRQVYEDGGIIPSETFNLRESSSGLCLSYSGSAGTARDGRGIVVLKRCNVDDDRQRWHAANQDVTSPNLACCSGLRAWNTDQCLNGADEKGSATTFVCDISGQSRDQLWSFQRDGQLKLSGGGFLASECLQADGRGYLRKGACKGGIGVTGIAEWSRHMPSEPIETKLYAKALSGPAVEDQSR